MRRIWKQFLERFRREWNEDLARTQAAQEAAEMEFRRELHEALVKIREGERASTGQQKQISRLLEESGEHRMKIMELEQRVGMIGAALEGGGSFW